MLLLDTGATLTTFNKEWLEKEFKPGKDIEFVNNANGFGFSASDKMEMVILQLKTFSIGKIKLKKITTTAVDISKIQDVINVFSNEKITIAGVLGNDLLQQLKAVISYKKKRIFFEYNPKNAIGINMNFDDIKKLMGKKETLSEITSFDSVLNELTVDSIGVPIPNHIKPKIGTIG